MNDHNYLFNELDWRSVQDSRRQSILDEIDNVDGNRLLNMSVDDFCDYFEGKYKFDVPVLCEESEIIVDNYETKIDVSKDITRAIRDRSRPYYIPGTCIEIVLPFSGEAAAFKIRPSSFLISGSPCGRVENSFLVFRIEGINLEQSKVKEQIYHIHSRVKQYIRCLKEDADSFNDQIAQFSRSRIEQRRERLLADQNLLAGLGFRLKKRDDASKTFVVSDVRKRITPAMPSASTDSYEPEPILSKANYEHILSVMTNMVLVMERSPSAFNEMDENALRTHFLVQLNGQYEGQATGETFNYEGKTDILIRKNGKNIFIAECKYWSGTKKLSNTIDQLLGYASWRDTKVAIVIFNRNKNFSQVLERIPKAIKTHSNFKKELKSETEGKFRYLFAHRDDVNREMILTVLAFDVPQTSGEA